MFERVGRLRPTGGAVAVASSGDLIRGLLLTGAQRFRYLARLCLLKGLE